MQAQDTTTLFLLKWWPWVEANKNRLIAGTAIVAIVILLVWFMTSQREQKELAAGLALTQLSISASGPSMADDYLKIAAQHAGTAAGRRAWLQGAATLFDAGKFAEAQAQFQKYLDANPDTEFSGQATLGVAASLDAQGKTDLAVGAYQRVLNSSSDAAATSAAKFALARIDESQGRLNDALVFYQDVSRANPNSSLGSEATLRLIELRSKMPAPAPAPAPMSSIPAVPAK
jgi:predicted negative regulator of RcsB-dependent stress response